MELRIVVFGMVFALLFGFVLAMVGTALFVCYLALLWM